MFKLANGRGGRLHLSETLKSTPDADDRRCVAKTSKSAIVGSLAETYKSAPERILAISQKSAPGQIRAKKLKSAPERTLTTKVTSSLRLLLATTSYYCLPRQNSRVGKRDASARVLKLKAVVASSS